MKTQVRGGKLGVYIATHNNPMFLRMALLQLEAQTLLPNSLAVHENGHTESKGVQISKDVIARLTSHGVDFQYDHTDPGLSHPFFHYLPLKRLVEAGCEYFMKMDHDDIFYEEHIRTLVDLMRVTWPHQQWIGQRRADVLVLNPKAYLYRENRKFIWNPLGGPSDSFIFSRAVAEEYLKDMQERAGTGEADDFILYKYTLPKFPHGGMTDGKATMCYVSHGRNDSTKNWITKPPEELL